MNLDFIPLWVWFLGTVAIILIAIEAGFRIGRRSARTSQEQKESPAATMGGAVLGLVGFILAFTFSIAAGRFDARKELVRNEANAIGTAYLRADFLTDPDRQEVRRLLREYVEIRVTFAQHQDMEKLSELLARTSEIHNRLWANAVQNARRDPNPQGVTLFVESINDVIDIHGLRRAIGIDARIPSGIWCILYMLSVLGMTAMGYQSGIAASKRSPTILIVAGSFALVILLIAGLDRPNNTFISVTQKPLIDVQNWMNAAADRPSSSQ
jgi:hypothetical protein